MYVRINATACVAVRERGRPAWRVGGDGAADGGDV